MTEPEVGHADSDEDLSTPDDDYQVEPGAEPWVEDDDDAEPGSS
jgi:hypothetical protein